MSPKKKVVVGEEVPEKPAPKKKAKKTEALEDGNVEASTGSTGTTQSNTMEAQIF